MWSSSCRKIAPSDSYFGTFPGADGFPQGVCVPLNPSQPQLGCVAPFHDVHDINAGGPHHPADALADLDDGFTKALMDGFVYQQKAKFSAHLPSQAQAMLGAIHHDVMGYHTDAEISNYWTYAKQFVLQDHMFEGIRSWSWPEHIEMASQWVARCTDPSNAMSCVTEADLPQPSVVQQRLPWANMFQLLDHGGVSWKYYVSEGVEPDCADGDMTCPDVPQKAASPSIWNVPAYFTSVRNAGKQYIALHNPKIDQFYEDVRKGTLPSVSWIVPDGAQSEHPPNGVTLGMEYVTTIINAIAQSPYATNTAILLSWDDWGGIHDHEAPPIVDTNSSSTPVQGYGLRVPGLLINAYARPGMIDHSILSADSYATFIEDLFLNSTRLNPTALGIPDNRPDLRDSLTSARMIDGTTVPIGNLLSEFNFNNPPQAIPVLPTAIPAGIIAACGVNVKISMLCTTSAVTVSWTALTAAQGSPPFTYHLVRDAARTPVCTTTALACTDHPGSGTHLYRAFSVDAKGVTSPLSAATEADEP